VGRPQEARFRRGEKPRGSAVLTEQPAAAKRCCSNCGMGGHQRQNCPGVAPAPVATSSAGRGGTARIDPSSAAKPAVFVQQKSWMLRRCDHGEFRFACTKCAVKPATGGSTTSQPPPRGPPGAKLPRKRSRSSSSSGSSSSSYSRSAARGATAKRVRGGRGVSGAKSMQGGSKVGSGVAAVKNPGPSRLAGGAGCEVAKGALKRKRPESVDSVSAVDSRDNSDQCAALIQRVLPEVVASAITRAGKVGRIGFALRSFFEVRASTYDRYIYF